MKNSISNFSDIMPIIVEQIGNKNLWIKSRNKDGEVSIKIDETFQPYFYDDKMQKVIVDKPSDVPEARKQFSKHYEADIVYPQRYIIDRLNVPFPNEPLRICYFDIETNASLDITNTPEPIICISCFDNFFNRFVTFTWREDLKNEKTQKKIIIEEWGNIEIDASIYTFNTEELMLNKFISFIEDTDPDILAGWNSGGISKYKATYNPFDIPYLLNRMRLLKIDEKKLSPLRFTRIDIIKKRYSIKGRVLFDLMEGYKKIKSSVRNSLDYVSEHELKLRKLKINDIWKDIDRLIKYNIGDVYLAKEIDKKARIIEAYNNLRILTGCIWEGIVFEGMLADAVILREARKRGTPLKSKDSNAEREEIMGAFVMKVTPGLHKNVVVLDLKSLYPSLICQFNISFDTIKSEYEKDDIKLDNGIIFRQDIEGIVPSVLKDLFILRDKYKFEKSKHERHSPEWETYDKLQTATKMTQNAFYGLFAQPRSRTYEPRAAESITWLGREIIKWTNEQLKKENKEVIYSDTDSTFIKFDKEVSIEEINQTLKILNDSYNEFVRQYGCEHNNYLKIDFKGIYKTIIFTRAKKKYIGWLINDGTQYIEPELDVVGFEIKRKDFNDFGRELMLDIFKMLLEEKKKEEIDRFILLKKDEMKNIKDIRKIALSKRLGKEIKDYKARTVILKGVEFGNRYLGETFVGGSEMNFIYCFSAKVKGKIIQTPAVCWKFNAPDEIDVDWDKMIELTIYGKVEKIYESLGWKFNIENETLDKWFK